MENKASTSFDVSKIAGLAYLKLSPEEQKNFSKQFTEILDYVNQIQSVPMSAEEAKAMGAFHVQSAFYEMLDLDSLESLREDDASDEALQSLVLNNAEALQNAPASSGLPNELLFEVPSILSKEKK